MLVCATCGSRWDKHAGPAAGFAEADCPLCDGELREVDSAPLDDPDHRGQALAPYDERALLSQRAAADRDARAHGRLGRRLGSGDRLARLGRLQPALEGLEVADGGAMAVGGAVALGERGVALGAGGPDLELRRGALIERLVALLLGGRAGADGRVSLLGHRVPVERRARPRVVALGDRGVALAPDGGLALVALLRRCPGALGAGSSTASVGATESSTSCTSTRTLSQGIAWTSGFL